MMIMGSLLRKNGFAFVLGIGLLLSTAGSALGVTVGDITGALDDNYGAINDLTCDYVVDSSNNDHDVSDATQKYKQATSAKFRDDGTSPSFCVICDGDDVAIEGVAQCSKSIFAATEQPGIGWYTRATYDLDILWILANNTFTLVGGTVEVGDVTCRKITSTAYDLYVDDSAYEKVIRIDHKSGSIDRRYDLGGYSYLESTAYFWSTIDASKPNDGEAETYDIDFSNISINDSLPDSDFQMP